MKPADRKSTRLNSSHVAISYAVFCLKKKNDGRLQAPLRGREEALTELQRVGGALGRLFDPDHRLLPGGASGGHLLLFFFNDTATTEIYTLSLHDALPI